MGVKAPVRKRKMATWEKAHRFLWEIGALGQEVYFRGQSDARWPLRSSLGRLVAEMADKHEWNSDEQKEKAVELEKKLSEEFRRACHRIPGAPELPENCDEFVARAQHHGLPTPFLDWSRSPYVAAFFAFEGNGTTASPHGSEVAIWAIDWEMFELLLYYDYRGKRRVGTVKKPTDLNSTLRAIQDSFWPRIERIQIRGNPDRRIAYQEGLFTRSVKIQDDIEDYLWSKKDFAPATVLTKVTIPASEQVKVLKHLSLMTINPVVLMADADGAAATALNTVIRFQSD